MATTLEEGRKVQPAYKLANAITERPVELLSDDLLQKNIASGVLNIANGCVWGTQPAGTITVSALPVIVGCSTQMPLDPQEPFDVSFHERPGVKVFAEWKRLADWNTLFAAYVDADPSAQLVIGGGANPEFAVDAVGIDAGPLVIYDPSVLQEHALAIGKISEIVSLGTQLGAANNVPIARLKVYRFQSTEDPEHVETVVNFYSDAPEDSLIDFFPVLAEGVQAWRTRQRDEQALALAASIRVDVLPMSFWRDV